jgi:hypothetical protein
LSLYPVGRRPVSNYFQDTKASESEFKCKRKSNFSKDLQDLGSDINQVNSLSTLIVNGTGQRHAVLIINLHCPIPILIAIERSLLFVAAL